MPETDGRVNILGLTRSAFEALAGRGGRTTPPHMYVDLYNVLNSQRPVSLVNADNSLFGQVWARQLPRWTQIKATLKF
jgi:hypothetical protein